MSTTRLPPPRPRRHAGSLGVLWLAAILAGCAGTSSVAADDAQRVGLPSAAAAEGSVAGVPNQTATAPSATTTEPRATASASPEVTARPARPTSAPTPEPARKPFAMNLFRRGDFVPQYTFEWCVGASLQMAINLSTSRSDASRSSQENLWRMAQARSFSPFGGANPRGWTATLNELGIGPYELVSVPDFDGAVRLAATAIRQTKRPVGLVMWRGRHAWVMSGFESIGDPAIHDDATITGIRVLDPLYPHGSAAWGPSPKPNALIEPATLAKQFVLRDSTRVNLGVPPGFVLVLPTRAAAGVAAEPAA
jgi:hypothetical protein